MDEMKRKKTGSGRSINLMWIGIVFIVFYWFLESVRDVVVFEKGELIDRFFFPDPVSFWMRFLIVLFIILFSIHAQSMRKSIEEHRGKKPRSLKTAGIICAGMFFGATYWIIEAVREVIIFEKGNIIHQIFMPDAMSIWMRLLAVFVIVLFSVYAQFLVNDRRKVEEALRKEQEELERNVAERTVELTESNGLLRQEIEERKRAEKTLRIKDSAIFSSINAIVFADLEGYLTYVNPSFLKMWGYDDNKEVFGKSAVGFWQREKKFLEVIKKLHAKGSWIGELIAKRRDGTFFHVQLSASIVKDENWNPLCMMASFLDITEYKLAEEKIKASKASLEEKEVLLKEIHHRVKNNLQVICSLLSLQSRYIKDKQALEMFKESRDRIRSMALIHEKLYQSKDFAMIDFVGYIKSLVKGLYTAYRINPERIRLKVKVKDVSLGIDLAVPCGLIINELVSNALKHAFPPSFKEKGKIEIALYPAEAKEIELIVKDNGVGMQKDLDFRKTESFGMRLVTILAEDQLRGKIKLDREGGTKFTIRLKGE